MPPSAASKRPGFSRSAPTVVPAAVTDYTTGHLAALGVMCTLSRRAREGGSWHVRVSLARTAMWMQSLPRVPAGAKPREGGCPGPARALDRDGERVGAPAAARPDRTHARNAACAGRCRRRHSEAIHRVGSEGLRTLLESTQRHTRISLMRGGGRCLWEGRAWKDTPLLRVIPAAPACPALPSLDPVVHAAVVRVDRALHLQIARPAVERDEAEPEFLLRSVIEEGAPASQVSLAKARVGDREPGGGLGAAVVWAAATHSGVGGRSGSGENDCEGKAGDQRAGEILHGVCTKLHEDFGHKRRNLAHSGLRCCLRRWRLRFEERQRLRVVCLREAIDGHEAHRGRVHAPALSRRRRAVVEGPRLDASWRGRCGFWFARQKNASRFLRGRWPDRAGA